MFQMVAVSEAINRPIYCYSPGNNNQLTFESRATPTRNLVNRTPIRVILSGQHFQSIIPNHNVTEPNPHIPGWVHGFLGNDDISITPINNLHNLYPRIGFPNID